MRLSSDRILTTHTGSLPRPACLADRAGNGRRAAGRRGPVGRGEPARAGVDVVNDGEASKVGYSAYVTERLTGFGGEGEPLRPKDYEDFPGVGRADDVGAGQGPSADSPVCIGPVAYATLAGAGRHRQPPAGDRRAGRHRGVHVGRLARGDRDLPGEHGTTRATRSTSARSPTR